MEVGMEKTTIGLLGLIGVTVVAAGVLRTTTVKADAVDEISVTLSQACTITGSGMSSHSANIVNGQYNSAIGETTVNVVCNDHGGFAIYAVGFTGDVTGNNVLTSSVLGSTYDIATGTETSGSNSKWAMKLSTITDPAPTYPITIAGSQGDSLAGQNDLDYGDFQSVPASYTKVAYRTTGTDVDTGATFSTTYQAYMSSAQPAGSYSGKVKYTLVHPNSAPVPAMPMGLCNVTATCMQQATEMSLVALMPETGNTATMTDSRDGTTYTVGRLADGHYWLLDNLALDLTNSTVLNGMSAANTNATATTLGYLKGDTSRNASEDVSGNYATAGATAWTSAAKWTVPLIDVASKNLVPSDSISTDGGYKIGGYYNYCAATAGSYCYGDDAGLPGTSSGNASEDICPAGWRMPTGGSSGEYQALYNYYSTYNGYRTALHLPLAGYYGGNGVSYQGDYSFYWTSTRDDSDNMYRLGLANGGGLYPANSSSRLDGYSVRCVFGP